MITNPSLTSVTTLSKEEEEKKRPVTCDTWHVGGGETSHKISYDFGMKFLSGHPRALCGAASPKRAPAEAKSEAKA